MSLWTEDSLSPDPASFVSYTPLPVDQEFDLFVLLAGLIAVPVGLVFIVIAIIQSLIGSRKEPDAINPFSQQTSDK
jgi:hypothetical protein